MTTGTYVGNGTAGRQITGLGFQPDVVLIKGNDFDATFIATSAVMRTSTMPAGLSKPMVLDSALIANQIQSLDVNGFTVGNDRRVNQPGINFYWVAFKVDPDMRVGSYTGSGGSQSIPGLGFSPDYLVVMSSAPRRAIQACSAAPAAPFRSFEFESAGWIANQVTSLDADGFSVSHNAGAPYANEIGVTYHYVAWNAAPLKTFVGSYAGNATDNRNITGVGFRPEYLIVKAIYNNNSFPNLTPPPVQRMAQVAGDSTMNFSNGVFFADHIQAFQNDGFQIGAAQSINRTFTECNLDGGVGCSYFYVAFNMTSTNYRSIGTAADYFTGTVSVSNGSATVTGAGGAAWQTANRGRGDVITIPCADPPACLNGAAPDGVHYTVFGAGSETSLLLTQGYAGATASGLSYLIRRQFSTFAAWEDCIDGPPGTACPYFPVTSSSLVSDDRREVGIAYKDSPFLLTGDVFVQGSTTDATHTILLTADPGNRHNGVPGAGVVVDAQSGPQEFSIQDSNVTVEWLEFRGCRGAIGLNAVEIRADAGDLATNVLVQNLLVHDFDDPTPGHDSSGIALSGDLISLKSVTIRNTMIWDGDNYGIEGDNSADTAIIENVSIDGMLNSGIWAGNSAFTIRNTIVTSSPTADFARDTSGSLAGSNNTDSDGSGAVFFTNSLTAAAPTIFVVPNADLHLMGGVNSQVDSGLDLSVSFVSDIDGQSRSSLTWDRGADERDAPAIATADLEIAKDDAQTTAVPGGSVTYTITVTNNGPDTLNSLKVLDPTPSLLSPVFAPSSGSYDSATGAWTGLNLATTQSVMLTLTGTIDPFARGNLVNTATVAPPPGIDDPVAVNDSATDTDTLEPSADAQVVKTDDLDPAPLGGLLTYTLTVTNNGLSGATSVNVSDPLPADMDLDTGPGAITPSQGSCNYVVATRTVSCDLGNLGPTNVATVMIKVRPQALRLFSNTASVVHGEPDPVALNDSESETTPVEVSSLGVRFFTATSTSQRNVLEWINPTDADYVSTEVVVRGDRFPTAPGDGAPVYLSGVAGSGGRVKHLHDTGALSNGQTFYYAAFVHRSPSLPAVSPGRFVTGRPFDHVAGPVKWAFSTGATALAAPTVSETGVIATSNDKVVYAMKRGIGVDSGEWPLSFEPAPVGGPVQLRSPVVPLTIGDIVYLGAQNGSIYAIDATAGGGVPYLWVTSIGPMVQAAPAGIFGDLGGTLDYLLIGTRDSGGPNAFVALEPDTGNPIPIGSYDNSPGPAIGIVNGMAAVDYGPPPRVYFTSYEGTPAGSTLWCFDLKDSPDPVFNLLWERQLGNIDCSPVLRGGRVYVGSPQGGTVYSINAATGNDLDDHTFGHNNGQVKGFVFPDRATTDIYFATDDFVWGVTDDGNPMTNKFGPISLPGGAKPSPVLFTSGSRYLYVGGSDGKLYEIDVLGAPDIKSVTLGNGLAVVGAPSLDRVNNLIHVGSEAGIFYAVQVPLPPVAPACEASCAGQPNGTPCEQSPGDACVTGFVCCSSTCQPSCP